MRTLFKVFLVLLVLVLVAGGGVFLVVDPRQKMQDLLDDALVDLSARTGQQVRAGEVELSYRPLIVGVPGLRIDGTPGQPPILTVKRIEIEIEGEIALRSLGDDLRVRAVRIAEPRLAVSVSERGATSLDALIAALRKRRPAKRLDKRQREQLARQSIDVEVRGLEVVLTHPTGVAKLVQGRVDIEGFTPGEAFDLRLSAALFADRTNLRITARLGAPVLGRPGLPLLRAEAEAEDIALGALDLIPGLRDTGSAVVLEGARLDGRLTVHDPQRLDGPARWDGDLEIAGLRAGGDAFEVALRPRLSYSLAEGWIRFRKARIAVDNMALNVDGGLTGLTTAQPRFEAFELDTKGIELERIQALFPALVPGLTVLSARDTPLSDTPLSGPIAFELRGTDTPTAQQIEARLSLTDARIPLGRGRFKAAGTPLEATFSAAVSGATAFARALEIRIGAGVLDVRGTLERFSWVDPGAASLALEGSWSNGPRRLPLAISGSPLDPLLVGPGADDLGAQLLDAAAH